MIRRAARAKEPVTINDLAALRLYASRFFACLLWLHVPVVALIARSNGIPMFRAALVMSLAAVAGTVVALLGGDKLYARLTIAAALTVAPALMVYAGQGPWQVDWHMYFFVIFGMLVAYVDWRPIAVAAVGTAFHHVFLNAVFPDALFPESSLGRVALHCAIVLVDALVLFWIVSKMRELFTGSDRALQSSRDALAQSELLQSAVVHASDAVIISKVPRRENGAVDFDRRHVVYANEAMTAITGIPVADVMGKLFDSMFPIKRDSARFTATLEAAVRHQPAKIEMTWCVPDGREIEVEASFVALDSVDGAHINLVAVVTDLTERHRSAETAVRTQLLERQNAVLETEVRERRVGEERLTYAGYHDELTDLPNRRLLREKLGSCLAVPGNHCAVLVCDIDKFKGVNGALGQDVGDDLLVAIARRLGAIVRGDDTLARFGGDEFAILVEGATVDDLVAIAARALSQIVVPFYIDGHEIYLTASIGVGLSENESGGTEDVLRKAGLAMHHAKLLGKARVEFFTPELLKATERHLQLETELRRSLERSEIHAFYQPIVDLKSGTPVGFEALARWLKPAEGIISPDDFIPLAEDTGIIVNLGRHILEVACRDLCSWTKELPQFAGLWVSVNVSPVQLREADYIATVSEALVRNNLAGDRLHLEITETTIADLKLIGPILARLRSLGVHISIDDFGTGYSSLRYLDQLPIDSLKIDRSFVSGRGEGIANLKITQTIVGLARELGLDVVAEGVETESQAQTLRFLTRFGQGYLFGRPAAADASLAYLKTVKPALRSKGRNAG
jgi:diguanylate cyclase (GGDEF)-like protein/PAS domain S-box-containing protein